MWIELSAQRSACLGMAPFLRLAQLQDDGTDERVTALAKWEAKPSEMWEALQAPMGSDAELRVAEQVVASRREDWL